MIITAALAWFDEAPEDLDKFVRSLDGFVDRLVAVDGGYERYPGAAVRSPRDEEEAIASAAADIGLPVEVHIPDRVWAGQIEKRNHLIDLAGAGSDWIFTLDADHILHGIREEFRHEVEHVRVGCARIDIDFYTTINHERPLAETSSTDWHSDLAGEHRRMGLLMRALDEIRYERFHWWISAMAVPTGYTRQRVWVYGGDSSYPQVQGYMLQAPFFIEHRCHFRRDRNIIANRVFCEDRVSIVQATGQEDATGALAETAA
jgi:hypothetical protein